MFIKLGFYVKFPENGISQEIRMKLTDHTSVEINIWLSFRERITDADSGQ